MDLNREDRLITLFLQSLGPWKDQIVIGGGYALIIYRLYLANQEPYIFPVGTRDIDSLIPRKVPKVSESDISKYLKNAGFVHAYKDLENPPAESYIQEVEGEEIEIEFLTDDSARFNKEKNVIISGIVAQPLTYLKLSLSESIPFKTFKGMSGIVVSPEAWIFHKGLTFVKRKNKSKYFKDLYGIWYVLTQLGDFSLLSVKKFNELAKEQTSWYKTFRKNLKKWIEEADPIDWENLELQDDYGVLKKLNFLKLMESILN